MKVDLSPGEWAGVLHAVMQESRRLDRLTDEYGTDFREDGKDLARIGRIIREAIDADAASRPSYTCVEPWRFDSVVGWSHHSGRKPERPTRRGPT